MSALVNELILENKGTFENKRINNIYEYGVYGKTIRHKLYASDTAFSTASMSVYTIDKCERFVSQRAGCGKAASPDSARGIRPQGVRLLDL